MALSMSIEMRPQKETAAQFFNAARIRPLVHGLEFSHWNSVASLLGALATNRCGSTSLSDPGTIGSQVNSMMEVRNYVLELWSRQDAG